jgi:Sec-independent protein translocase protein TatA
MPASQAQLDAISKVLGNSAPVWGVLALAVVGFFARLPATIRAIGAFIESYRKTSHKITMEREKLSRARGRKNTTKKGNKGGAKGNG